MKSQVKAGVILSYLALFINSFISILYTPIMLKLLGQSEYGLYSLASSAIAYVGVLNFGLGNAVIRYTAKYKALKDEEKCSNLYGMFCIMYGTLGIIALILGGIVTYHSEMFFTNSLSADEIHKLKILMGVMTINIALGIGMGFFSVAVLAFEKFIFQKLLGIISSIISPIIILPFLIMGYASISMAIVTTLLTILTIIINVYYCFGVLKLKITFHTFDTSLLKEILGFSAFILLNIIIEKIYWSTDQIILGIYSGTIAVSVYTIGATFSGYFSGFSAAISNVFLSKVTRMVTNEVTEREISDLFIKVGRVQFIIISFALSGFIVFGHEFIYLWVGDKYQSSYLIAVVILVPMMIPLIQSMGGIILQAKNVQKFKSILYFVLAVANIFLSIAFVQKWGPIGCAVATAIAYTIGNIIIMNVYYWKKIKIDIPRFWMNIVLMSFPLILSIIFGFTLNKIMLAENWIIFLLKTIIFTVVYYLVMWFIGMNRYEKDLVQIPLNVIRNKLRKTGLYKLSS